MNNNPSQKLHGSGPNPSKPNGWTTEPDASIYYSSLTQKKSKDSGNLKVSNVTEIESLKVNPTKVVNQNHDKIIDTNG